MTEDRITPDMADPTDPLVTQTYREIADERSPEHLNRAILKDAAKAALPRYRRSVSWTRPMAWAATIALSVALVFEVTKVPAPDGMVFDDSAAKFETQKSDFEPPADAPVEALEEAVAPTAPAGRISNAPSGAPPQAATIKSTAKQAVPAAEPQKRQRADLRQNHFEERELAAPAANVEEFKLKDTDMLRRAEDTARMQNGENREPASASSAADAISADMAVQGAVGLSIAAPTCDESASASPETWLECIKALEEVGLADEATLQRELLSKAYPDFDSR